MPDNLHRIPHVATDDLVASRQRTIVVLARLVGVATVHMTRPPRLSPFAGGVLAAMLLLVAAPNAAAQDAQQQAPPETCVVKVRLVGIACNRAHDESGPEGGEDGRGEYYLRLDADAEIGPFELRSGESSSFSPGFLLKTIDTGVLMPSAGDEVRIPVQFVLTVREDDSTPPGEDDRDDRSEPVRVNELVTCPGSTTSASRLVRIPHDSNDDLRRKPDLLRLSLKIVAER